MQWFLDEARRAFGAAPRSFSLWHRLTYLHIPKPLWLWCDPRDRLIEFFRGQRRVLRDGMVVWGHVIQANALLYRPGKDNCPGEVVYGTDPHREVEVGELARVAYRLYQLKDTLPQESELVPIARYLTNERIRVFGMGVPRVISPRMRCAISTVLFRRSHLPDRMLSCPLLPIVVAPERPRLAMILPSRYWPAELVEFWSARSNVRHSSRRA